ncbi:hypothetical protein CN354_03585 [Bacillus cereus]|nr:hypothetical protein CN354_03585 [Bacillus cereus]
MPSGIKLFLLGGKRESGWSVPFFAPCRVKAKGAGEWEMRIRSTKKVKERSLRLYRKLLFYCKYV